jgi:hypothetical protein
VIIGKNKKMYNRIEIKNKIAISKKNVFCILGKNIKNKIIKKKEI